nr:hypothetical protein [Actinomycetota bacterium]
LLAGAVEAARLASHAGVVAGLVLVALMSRMERLPAPGPAQTATDLGSVDAAGGPRRRGVA